MIIISFAATSTDCADCNNYEKKLAHLREDLVDVMSTWVVKAIDSQLLQLYSNDREPVLIFFRHGLPLLYDGMDLTRNRNYIQIFYSFNYSVIIHCALLSRTHCNMSTYILFLSVLINLWLYYRLFHVASSSTGPLEDEDIITTFTENKAPTVKELTDDTFEHLTQASTGATTGDWFVML